MSPLRQYLAHRVPATLITACSAAVANAIAVAVAARTVVAHWRAQLCGDVGACASGRRGSAGCHGATAVEAMGVTAAVCADDSGHYHWGCAVSV